LFDLNDRFLRFIRFENFQSDILVSSLSDRLSLSSFFNDCRLTLSKPVRALFDKSSVTNLSNQRNIFFGNFFKLLLDKFISVAQVKDKKAHDLIEFSHFQLQSILLSFTSQIFDTFELLSVVEAAETKFFQKRKIFTIRKTNKNNFDNIITFFFIAFIFVL
jgi:hypothetical protein